MEFRELLNKLKDDKTPVLINGMGVIRKDKEGNYSGSIITDIESDYISFEILSGDNPQKREVVHTQSCEVKFFLAP